MAKMVQCCFCGKEIRKSFFKSEVNFLGQQDTLMRCCKDCHEKYLPYEDANKERFLTKIMNYTYSTKEKLNENDIAKKYVDYLNEQEHHKQKLPDIRKEGHTDLFCFSADGYFCVREATMDVTSGDTDMNEMQLILDNTHSANIHGLWFDKNDITKIEFCKYSSTPNTIASDIYTYFIRLNDETTITNKPCIIRIPILGKSLFDSKKASDTVFLEELKFFKDKIGSDLPVIKMSKSEFKKSVRK